MVINNDPCYAYLLEGNSSVDQKMVMAHVYGHCDFFKNNFYFSRTNRRMIDGMANHAMRIRRHIERQGIDKVETFIDVCLSLDNLIDPHSVYVERRSRRATPRRRSGRRGRDAEVAAAARQGVHGQVHQSARLHREAEAEDGEGEGEGEEVPRAAASATCCCS